MIVSKEYLGETTMDHMLINTRKPGYGISDQIQLKQACSATETNQDIEILHGASWTILLSR